MGLFSRSPLSNSTASAFKTNPDATSSTHALPTKTDKSESNSVVHLLRAKLRIPTKFRSNSNDTIKQPHSHSQEGTMHSASNGNSTASTTSKNKEMLPPLPLPTGVDEAPKITLQDSSKPASRHSSDFVTMTLAQRLNELSAANSEGLLDNDEYRLLRQNLFERFASSATVPSEPSIIPRTSPAARRHQQMPTSNTSNSFHSSGKPRPRPLSKSFDALSRSSTTRSTSGSIASQLHSLIRKASKGSSMNFDRTVPSPPISPTKSMHSDFNPNAGSQSRRSSKTLQAQPYPTPLVHKASTSSIKSKPLHSIHRGRGVSGGGASSDTRSVSASSLRTTHTTHTTMTSRSAHAPSSFHLNRHAAKDNARSNLVFNSDSSIYDDETLTSAEAVRQEVALVEKEMRGLMDAFGGLEMSMLTRPQQTREKAVMTGESPWASNASLVMEESRNEGIGTTFANESLTSLNTLNRSAMGTGDGRISMSVGRKILPERPGMPAFPIGVASAKARPNRGGLGRTSLEPQLQTPLSANSATLTSRNSKKSRSVGIDSPHLSTSNVSPTSMSPQTSGVTLKRSATTRSNASLQSRPNSVVNSPVLNSGIDINSSTIQEDGELNDVRRRRVEVAQRYEARLEFLRAKLKNAEMREKLSK